jgi:cytoskeletal protein CcmA (bactofilin family)
VAEQGKKYKPLLEALVSKTDGLDILAEITGEEKKPEEKKEAAAPAPTDTFSGMLQTLPMLIMLPAIMPLLQQTLSQTLSSTTVNVKVESATAIVPIEISASTAIVPIEIKASSVTLNVNISGSNVTLNVNITGSDVTFNVNVQGGTVNVTGTVSISGTVNVSGTVSISGTVNVTGTVSISGTVNATITGTVNVNILTQQADIKIFTPSGRWVTASDLISTYTDAYGTSIPAGSEQRIINIPWAKRGRLKYIGIWVSDNGQNVDVTASISIRIYIDGSLKADIPLGRLDFFMGFPAYWLKNALAHALFTGISLPFNTARVGTNPDKYLVMPFHDGPRGTMTYLIYNHTAGKIVEVGGYLEAEFEFTNSAEIKMYNSSTTTLYGGAAVIVGEYL